jgi:hypothetical protein
MGAGLPGRRRLLAGLAVLAGAGLLLALGSSGLLTPLLFDVGLFRGLRFPARWAVFPHLALALAAGAGLDGWIWGRFQHSGTGRAEDEGGGEARESASRRRVALSALGGGLLLLLVLAALSGLDPEARAARDPLRTAVGALCALAGVAAIVAARRGSVTAGPGLATLVVALAVAPLPYLAGEALASVPASAVSSPPATLSGLARGPQGGRIFAPAGLDRTLALRWRYADGQAWGEGTVSRASAALAGYTNLFHGLATAGSASPIGNPRTERLVGVPLAGGDAAGILALLNVRYVVTPFAARVPGLRLGVEQAGIRRYDVTGAYGRAYFPLETRIVTEDEAFETLRLPGFDPGRVALVIRSAPGSPLPPARSSGSWAAARFLTDEAEKAELVTTASAPALLVLTRSWDPGWEARIDGEPVPVHRVQIAFFGVVVPPGEHHLEIAYWPVAFRIGLGLSVAGLLGVLALALAGPPGGRLR